MASTQSRSKHWRGNARVALIVVLCAIATLGIWIWTWEHEEATQPVDAVPLPVATAPAARDELTDTLKLDAPRTVASQPSDVAPPASTSATVPQPAAPADTVSASDRVRGLALDTLGAPVANVGVRWNEDASGEARAVSGRDGSFELTVARHTGMLLADDERFATVRASVLKKGDAGDRYLVIVAPAIDLAGTIIDEAGSAIAGAELRIDMPLDRFAGFPHALDATEAISRDMRSDAAGHFEFHAVPGASRVSLHMHADGFDDDAYTMPSETRRDVTLTLKRTSQLARAVTGVVVLNDGQPVADATVRLGFDATKTDRGGRFRLPLGDWTHPASPLVAGRRGYQSAVVPRFGELVQPGQPLPQDQRLVLGDTPLTISGRVLQSDDTPAANWTVRLLDGTNTTPGMIPAVLAESIAAGIDMTDESQELKTDSQGKFEIAGLSARAYKLRCLDLRSFVSFESDSIPAGTQGVVLRVPKGALWPRLDGRVRAADGAGVGNVRIALTLITARGEGGWTSTDGAVATTDANGAFSLTDVPHHWTYLDVSGDAVMPTRVDLDEVDPAQEFEISVTRRCHFSFESTASANERPDGLELRDGAGGSESLWLIQGNGWSSMSHVQLHEGKSSVLSASEGSKVLVLMRAMKEIDRVPFTLAPGDVQTVRK